MTTTKFLFPGMMVQAPLAGVSTSPFRLLATEQSQPSFCYTEMISCKTLLHQSKAINHRYTYVAANEGPVCFQLSSNQPHELRDAVKIAEDHGASLIDLNCGCPVNKVRRKGCGSKLLSDPILLQSLIASMKQNTHLPVSIKIRVQSRFDDILNHEIVKAIQDGGADFITVHGRHWHEHYETPVHYDQIAYFVDALSIPVIGNGDICDLASLNKMLETGCHGVMIGRAGVGQPWLIKKLRQLKAGELFSPPSLLEIRDMFMQHVDGLITLLNSEKKALYEPRQFAKYYARFLSEHTQFVNALYRVESKEMFAQALHDYWH